jgi:HSP20 family protein
MARDTAKPARSLMEWSPRFPAMRWPARWMDLFDEDDLIRVEEVVEDHTLVIRAELPGVDPDKDVELTVDNGRLTVRAERHEEKEEKDRHRRRSEFRYGSFTRSVQLPAGASEADVKATFANGILEVRVPVDGEKAEAKKIAITKV